MSVASSRGSPWRIAAGGHEESLEELVVDRRPRSSKRVPARHTWPALSNWLIACRRAASGSASAKIRNGDLPPSSSEAGVRLPAAARATSRPVSTEPVNATRSTSGSATSAAPASSPMPCTTLNTPSGTPASRAHVGEQGRRERRPFGRLLDHGVPGGEGRRDPPRGQHQRRVPRAHDRGDARRVPGHPLGVPVVDGVGAPFQLQQPVGEEPEVPRHARHDGAEVRAQQRSVVARLDRGQVRDPALHAIGDPMQDLGALLRRRATPALEGVAGRPDRGADVFGGAAGDLRDDGFVDRRDVIEAVRRRHALPADPMIGGDLDPLDRRVLARGGSPWLRARVVRVRTVWWGRGPCQTSDG